MRIGITGASGLIGHHIASAIAEVHGADALVFAPRAAFEQSPEGATLLKAFSRSCEVIIHLAGVNRENEASTYDDNPRLAAQLVESLSCRDEAITLIFSSSIQTL